MLCSVSCGGDNDTLEPPQSGGNATASPRPSQTQIPVSTPEPTPSPSVEIEDSSSTKIFYGDSAFSFGELYLPEDFDLSRNLITVVLLHGGCWSSSFDYSLMKDLSQELRASGFVVWNLEYRSIGNGGEWPTMFTDVANGMDYVRELARQYPIRLDHVLISGHSAGGHLALWLASRGGLQQEDTLYQTNPLIPRGVLGLAAIGDLESPACGAPFNSLLGGEGLASTRLYQSSPIQMLPTGVKSILLSGDTDFIVPPILGENYVRAASSAGDQSRHVVLEQADHFTFLSPAVLDWGAFTGYLKELDGGP